MMTFKSPQDLQKLPSSNPAHPIIQNLIKVLIEAHTWPGHPYLPEDYGYIVLIEERDVDSVLTEIWDDWKLTDIPWEGVTMSDDHSHYLAVFLANNEFGIVFVIPDAEWLTGEVREMLNDHLDPV